jgi:hypothetical protein
MINNNSISDPDFRNHVKAALSMINSQEIPNNLANKLYVGKLVSNVVSASASNVTTANNSYQFPLITLPTSNNAYLLEFNLLSTDTSNSTIIGSVKYIVTALNSGNGVVIINTTQTILNASYLWTPGLQTIGNTIYVGSTNQAPLSVTWTSSIISIIGSPTPFTVQPPQ